MAAVVELLAQAKAAHCAGRLSEAVALYDLILAEDADNAEVQYLRGAACHSMGKSDEAAVGLRHAARLRPDHVEAHHHLGVILAQLGRCDEAISCFQQALALRPHSPEISGNLRNIRAARERQLGDLGLAQGDLHAAALNYRRAIELHPDFAEVHDSLGVILEKQGDLAGAAACFRRALELKPDLAEAHYNLGIVLDRQGQLEEAGACYQRALDWMPELAEAHNSLGVLLAKREAWDQAEVHYRRAAELKPTLVEAHNNLAAALLDQYKLDEAASCCRRALELNPDYADAHANLGAVFEKQEKFDEAIACYRRTLELKPDRAEVHNRLGCSLTHQARPDEASACFRRALELKPDFSEVHQNRGLMLMHQGQPDEAFASFQEALAIQPRLASAHSCALLAMHYRSGVTPAQLAAAHREFDSRHAVSLPPARFDNSRQPDRRLRIGFVSPDLVSHPVGYFLVSVLENLDRQHSRVTCYSDRFKGDAMTDRLRAAASDWRNVRAMNDRQLAEQIRADRIDILFDLTGHFGSNRLPMFAHKPAPIQITWMGYVGTTGLSTIDYLLADRYHIPESAEAHVWERVLRMPDGYVCYAPRPPAPSVSPLPAIAQGHVTFGSFNNPMKITSEVIDVWAEILRRVPDSRLVLKYHGLDAASVSNRIAGLFAERGIARTRLDLLGGTAHGDLMRQYHRIDVALDPFPYSGGLTTCEALWMGVPVVTCPGETFASRHSLSHLSNVGLTETIAADRNAYVRLAVDLAGDLPRLNALRAGLRGQMTASPLCDGPRFAENFMLLLRGAWKIWCVEQN